MKVATNFGVEFRLSTPVKSVLLDAGKRKAKGVVLEDGLEVLADVVICNADLVTTFSELLPPSRLANLYSKRPTSCSSVSFYWSLSKRIPELDTHKLAKRYEH